MAIAASPGVAAIEDLRTRAVDLLVPGGLVYSCAVAANDWANYIRDGFPEKAKNVDTAASADGQVKGYSVTAEICANMAETKQITYHALEEIFTLGKAPVGEMEAACHLIEEVQQQ